MPTAAIDQTRYISQTVKPTTLNDLKALPQWVGYTAAKVPMNPRNGRAASSNDPATWGTAGEAWDAKKRYGWAGIGFVFTIAAGIIGVDLDDCYDDNGKLTDEAWQVATALDSYTELSPSGKGLHILARGSIPHSVKRPGFEMYNELRYFTVTGNRLRVYSPNIEERDRELNALFVTMGGDVEPKPPPPIPPSPSHNNHVNETDIARALACLPARGDYNTHWLPALMAVHSALPDERGIRLIEAWSPGYKGEVARKWHSFNSAEPSGITIATLFHMAKQYGYQPPGRGIAPKMSHSAKMSMLARA